MTETVLWEQENAIGVLTINRPEVYNAFEEQTVYAITERLMTAAVDPDIQAIVITGAGKAFCAGGDLRWASGCSISAGKAFHRLAAHFHIAVTEMRHMPKPVIAAINGFAAGGGFSLALACDFRVMARSAKLKQGYTSNGLSLDGGGTYTLARLVGMARALEIAAFDEPIDAQKALQWGLVTEVAEDGQALQQALAMAERLKVRPLTSFAASKRLLGQAFETALETQLEDEREWIAWCAEQPDGREGLAAFLEKRQPRYNQP